ncbi:MAG: hypothetical protein ABSF65_04215 [Candidatus Bathyarchaeia archaeon]|jgi:hypothetical protein
MTKSLENNTFETNRELSQTNGNGNYRRLPDSQRAEEEPINPTSNSVLSRYYEILNSMDKCPPARTMRYNIQVYAQIKALQEVFGTSEQAVINYGIGALFNEACGMKVDDVRAKIKENLKPNSRFHELKRLVNELHALDGTEKRKYYPTLAKIQHFNWKKSLEALESNLEEMKSLDKDIYINSYDFTSIEGEITTTVEKIRLEREIIRIQHEIAQNARGKTEEEVTEGTTASIAEGTGTKEKGTGTANSNAVEKKTIEL